MMVRKLAVGFGVILIGCAAMVYWLFFDIGQGDDFRIDVAELRALAESLPGDKPLSIRVEEVAMMESPGSVIVAGDSLGATRKIPVFSYQILFPDAHFILETALPRHASDELGGVAFDEAAYQRLQTLMLHADGIVVTHEHSDHMGGVYYHPQLEQLGAQLLLTPEQLAEPAAYAGLPELTIPGFSPTLFDTTLAIAPGVVLLQAPGHTPGSLMVFVTLVSGKEFLFVGDIAWHYRNVEVARPKARIASQIVIKEDYSAVLGQIHALSSLQQTFPDLNIVAGHDWDQNEELVASGLMTREFLVRQR